MRIENVIISRGHIILWLEKKAPAEEKTSEPLETKKFKTDQAFPRYVFISGELGLSGKFYADTNREWYWVKKPEDSVYFRSNLDILGTVTYDEKLQIIMAAEERNKASSENVQIIFDPIVSAPVEQDYKNDQQKQEAEEYPCYDCKREDMYFYGVSRVFSTKNDEQYKAIGEFWDEMSAQYGRENLQGLGYFWTGDTMSYAIGLKEGELEDYDVEIWLPGDGWKSVKGRTDRLGQIYDSIYRDGSLTYEIETFSADGECEISFYRIGDAWMDEGFEVNGIVFDTAKCSAFYRPKRPDHIVLMSNFMYTGNSSIHWWDEASYGMCTHPCTKEESRILYQILRETTLDQWHFTAGIRYVRVTEEIRQKALEFLWEYLQSENTTL